MVKHNKASECYLVYHGVPVVPGVPPGLAEAGPGDDRPGLAGTAQPSSEGSDWPPEDSGGSLRAVGTALSQLSLEKKAVSNVTTLI